LIDVFATAVRGRVFMEGGFVLVHAAIAANPESVEVVDSGCCAIYALAGDPGENGCVERIVHTSGPHLHVNSLFCCLADTRAPLFQAGALDDVIAALLQFPDDKLLQNNGVLALGWLAGEPSECSVIASVIPSERCHAVSQNVWASMSWFCRGQGPSRVDKCDESVS
jgi:hypothetical protein